MPNLFTQEEIAARKQQLSSGDGSNTATPKLYTQEEIEARRAEWPRVKAQSAADSLQRYSKQIESVYNDFSTASKSFESGENKSAKDYQSQVKTAQDRLKQILSGISENQKVLEDTGFMNDDVRDNTQQIQKYVQDFDSSLSNAYQSAQDEADFERKPLPLQLLETSWSGIKSGLSKAGTGMWETLLGGESIAADMERQQNVLKDSYLKSKNADGSFRGAGASRSFDDTPAEKILGKVHNTDEALQAEKQQLVSFADNKLLAEAISGLSYSLGNMIPTMVTSLMSGGINAPASVLSGAPFSSGTVLSSIARSTVANPSFWSTALPMYGNTYYEAKQEGASESEAEIAGLLNGFLGGAIETSGGTIGVLPTNKTSTLVGFIKDALSEGGEEVAQGIVENAVASAIYRAESPVFSMEDTQAIINPVRALKEFALGTVAGGLFGGAQAGVNAIANRGAQANLETQDTTPQQEIAPPKRTAKTIKSYDLPEHYYPALDNISQDASKAKVLKSQLEDMLDLTSERIESGKNEIAEYVYDYAKNHAARGIGPKMVEVPNDYGTPSYYRASDNESWYSDLLPDGGYVSKETAKVIAEEIVLNPKYAGIAYDPELVDYVKAYQESKYVYDRLFGNGDIESVTSNEDGSYRVVYSAKGASEIGDINAYRTGAPAATLYTPNAVNADTQSDTDIQASRDYSQSADAWTAQNANNPNTTAGIRSLGDIVTEIEKAFGIPISTGKISQPSAAGIFKRKSEAVRTQVTNALPVISHEVGHYIDKQHNLTALPEISEAVNVFKTTNPTLAQKYTKEEMPGEAIAEFVRDYLADRTAAQQKYPTFYTAFRNAVSPQNLQKLDGIGDMVNAYMTADSLTQLKSAITNRGAEQRKRSIKEKLFRVFDKLNLGIHDSAAPFKKVSEDAYLTYMQSLNSDGQTRYIIEEGMTDVNGNLVSDTGLSQVLSEIPSDKIRDFESYLVAKHAVEWVGKGKRVFSNDKLNNAQFMQHTVSNFESENPQFASASEKLYQWQRELMKTWLVDTGVITQELYSKLWSMYPNYVPFYRNVDKQSGGNSAGKQSSPIKTAKGSGLDLYSPIENIVINIDRFVKTANKNAVLQEVVKATNTVDGLGNIVEPVPASRVPKSVSTESARVALESALEQSAISNNDVQTVMQTFDDVLGEQLTEWNISMNQDGDIVWAFVNGERKFFQVHDADVLNSLTSLGGKKSNEFIRFMMAVSRTFKTLVTGSNPFFTIGSNVWRDFVSAFVQGGEGNVFKLTKDIVLAYRDIIKDTDSYKRYKASGSTYASMISHPKEISSFMNSIYNADRSALKRFFSNFVSVVEGIEHFSDVVETAPRLAEFNRVFKDTGDAKKAAYSGAEVTVNFKRSGTVSRQIDAIYPYFNAQVQSISKQTKTAVKNPITFISRAVGGLAIASAIQMFINHIAGGDDEYKKLSSYIKNNYYNFYVGDGKFLRIPKAQSLAVASSALERAYEMMVLDNPDAFYDFAGYMTNQFIPSGVPNPVDGFKPIATDIVGVGSLTEIMANEDFKGTPIVPSQYEKLQSKQQYNDKTSWIAKQVGKLLNWSPMQIDHFINSNSGVLGKLNRALTANDKDFTVGLSNQFVSDSAYSSDVLNRFYEQLDDAEVMKNSYTDSGEYMADYKQLNSARSIISEMNKIGRGSETEERDYKILSRDFAADFMSNPPEINERLVELYERTGNTSIFYDKEFSNSFTIDGIEKTLSIDKFVDYANDYNSTVSSIYDNVLSADVGDDLLVKALVKVKADTGESSKQKAFGGKSVGVVEAVELGIPARDYLMVKLTASTDGNSSISQDEAKAALDKTSLSQAQKSLMWSLINSRWKTNPYGGKGESSTQSSTDYMYNFWGGINNGN